MKKVLFAIFFSLLMVKTAIPVFANNYLDGLNREYKSAKTDTARYRLLYKIINEYLETGSENYNPDAVAGLLDKTLEELRGKKDSRRFESFLRLKGLSCFIAKKYELANQYYDSCILISEKCRDNNELGDLYILQEMVFHLLNLEERRVRSLYNAIESYQKAGSLKGQAGAYFTLANIYVANKHDDLAVATFLKGADIRNKLHDSIGAGVNYLFCAATLMRNGNLKLAGEYLKKGKPVIYSTVTFQPLYYYIIYGRWLKAMNRKEEALYNLEMGANIAVKGNQRYQKPMALCEMAEIYIDEKRFGKAKQVLEEAKTIAYQERHLSTRINVRKVFSKYYEAIGDPFMALEEFKLMQALKDSSNQNELSRALTNSAMEAEYSKIESERSELQRIKDEKEAQKLRRHKLITYSTGVIILFVSFIVFLLYRSYKQKKKTNSIIAAEKKRSDDLLHNILPEEVAAELKATGTTKAKDFMEVTVLFTDFKNFTAVSESLSAQELVNEINYLYSAFDEIVTRNGIEKIKTIGDSYMCAGGLPVENPENSKDIVRAALEMRDFILLEKQKRFSAGLPCFEVRIGLHSGPVVAGVVGTKKFAYDIWGDTVNIASRMESSGEPGKVNISSSTYELVKDHFICKYRGKIEAKNKGMIDMYFVETKKEVISNF